MISKAFNWWVDGLAAALLGLQRRMRRQPRFRLDQTTWPPVLKPLDRSGRASGSIAVPDPLSAGFLSQIRRRTRGSVLEIVVPGAAVMERRLDPLPRESEPYVESVIEHQLETLFPWSAKDILHAKIVEKRGDGKIDVTVRATSRPPIDPALSIAAACEASQVVLVGSTGAGQADLAPIPVFLGKETSAERARAVARYAIAALLVGAVCVIGWTSFTHWSAAAELAALERTIADRRALLMRASASRGDTGRDGLEARRLQGVPAVLVIERLSELLPDDTYLTDLTVDGERVRLSGVTGQAADLVPLLEKSGYFRNASFYAPTTRMAGKATDRFSIEAVIIPAQGTRP
jgi:general secretion pathway protein L